MSTAAVARRPPIHVPSRPPYTSFVTVSNLLAESYAYALISW
uniref:Uncharacterized protein n=1 Tax=Arundo donax TaxID=35708 RepID=A0A0A9BEI7_ARUDO